MLSYLKIKLIKKIEKKVMTYDIANNNSLQFNNEPNFVIGNDKIVVHNSRHAAGVVSAEKLYRQMPLQSCSHDGGRLIITSYTEGVASKTLGEFGFLKFDILGLATLRVFENAFKLIAQRNGKSYKEVVDSFHSSRLDMEDHSVFENVFHKGNFCGVFQYSEQGIRSLAKQIRPDTFVDVATIGALYRPGPIGSGMHKEYAKMKELDRKGKLHYENEIEKKILGETYSVVTFQDQFMLLVKELGDFSWAEVNAFRKSVVKRSKSVDMDEIHKQWKNYEIKFKTNAVKKGISEKHAIELWDRMMHHAGYSFNRCLHGSTTVEFDNGEKKSLYEINDNDYGRMVKTYDYDKKEVAYSKLVKKHNNGKKRLFKITLGNGKKVICTMNHKLMCEDGVMHELQYILENDYKIMSKQLETITACDIMATEEVGYKYTYDIELEKIHHFIANDGPIVSNSHSLLYGLISYQCAYLATHYPLEFYASVLTFGGTEEFSKAVREIKSSGINVLFVDINKSTKHFEIEENSLRIPLSLIKGIGDKVCDKIIEERKNGEYTSFTNFLERSYNVGSSNIRKLIDSGAFDCFITKPGFRKALVKILEMFEKPYYVIDNKGKEKKQKYSSNMKKFENDLKTVSFEEYTFSELKDLEYSYFDANIMFGVWDQPEIKDIVKNISKYKKQLISSIPSLEKIPICESVAMFENSNAGECYIFASMEKIKTLKDKRKQEMAFVAFRDRDDEIFESVIFSSLFKHSKDLFNINDAYLIRLHKNDDDKIMYGMPGWGQSRKTALQTFIPMKFLNYILNGE